MAEHARTAGWSRSAQEWMGLCGCVALFLIGPTTPQLLRQWHSGDELRIVYEGPVYFPGRASYSLEIQNDSRLPKHRVRIRAPLPRAGDVLFAAAPYETVRPMNSHDEPGYRVLELGDLGPGERYALGVHTSWTPGADPVPWVMAQVASSESAAVMSAWRFRAYRDEADLRWYQGAFNLMTAAVVLLLILLIKMPGNASPAVRRPVPKEAWRRPPSRP